MTTNQQDKEFLAKLYESFKIEAEEHLKALNDRLLTLEKGPSDQDQKDLIKEVFREAHSLKGAARAVNLESIERVCQTLEDVLALWRSGEIAIQVKQFDLLYQTFDYIEKIVIQEAEVEEGAQEALIENLQGIAHRETEPSAEVEEAPAPASPYQAKEPPKTALTPPPKEPEKKTPEQPKNKEAQQRVKDRDQTIRVSEQKLDRLLQHVEEMLSIKLNARQNFNDLKKINETLDEWAREWKELTPNMREESHEHFVKSFREELGQLIHRSEQDSRLVSGMVGSVLSDTKTLLMQPFSTLFDAFPRMVRDIAQDLGKEVNLVLKGREIEIDRRILEQMKDPMIHMIRNCIDHGIETPELRQAGNKLLQGKITISVSEVCGSSVEMLISDDGKGIDLERVKEKALENGILSSKELALKTEKEILMLVFHPGLSTSPIVTDLSGRGVGLDIVSENVERLGGKVELESTLGVGTTLRLSLPLTLATFRGILVRVSGRDFVMPTNNVTRVVRLEPKDIKGIENRDAITLDGKTLSFFHLRDIFRFSKLADESKLLAIVVRSGEHSCAFGVDQVLNEQEIFVKGLGKQLEQVDNMNAATILEWGKVVPILNPFDLIKNAIDTSISTMKEAAVKDGANVKSKRRVLVVDDSVTARMLLTNIMESAGFEVTASVDGKEAFSILNTEEFDLLLSDVDMPRMNGFELAEKVRNTEKLKELPVVLCTNRGSKEDREHGIEVGANAYLDKSSFQQSNLLEIVSKLL